MIFAKSAIAQLALLLSASSSSSVVVVGASKTPTETNDYEPNGRLVHKPIMPHNVATERINRRHHDNNNKAHHSLRKLKSSASNGTGGSKSSKSAQPPEEGGGDIFGYLDRTSEGCPCYTAADIDQAWVVLQKQDPEAYCEYYESYLNMELQYVTLNAYSVSNFTITNAENGPKFFDPNDPSCCEFDFFNIDDGCSRFCDVTDFPASGHCTLSIDESDITSYTYFDKIFSADNAKYCFEEIMKSDMINKCNSITYDN